MLGKVKIEVFIPHGACSCTFASFMDRVWRVLMNYRDKVDYHVKTLSSPEAKKYGIVGMSVLVNEEFKFPPNFDEKKLEEAIQQILVKHQVPYINEKGIRHAF